MTRRSLFQAAVGLLAGRPVVPPTVVKIQITAIESCSVTDLTRSGKWRDALATPHFKAQEDGQEWP